MQAVIAGLRAMKLMKAAELLEEHGDERDYPEFCALAW